MGELLLVLVIGWSGEKDILMSVRDWSQGGGLRGILVMDWSHVRLVRGWLKTIKLVKRWL